MAHRLLTYSTRRGQLLDLSIYPHFVCPPRRLWPELSRENFEALSPEVLRGRCINGFDCWVLRTYYELRVAGRPVTIGPTVAPGRVNIVGVRDFGRRDARADAFFAIPRLDAHDPKLADFVIHQNGLRGRGPTWDWVPHWAQPGMEPRDPARQARVERLVFKGAEINLDADFKLGDFREALASVGVTLDIDVVRDGDRDNNWGDYRGADAVLAARNLTEYDARQKPASKLINAWRGEVPALLGPEPAYQEQRRSELDYLEVRGPRDVIAAIKRLQEQPGLFAAMVENGRDRRVSFDDEHLRARWEAILDGSLSEAFDRWRRLRWPARRLRTALKLVAEGWSRSEYQRRIRRGDRILSPSAQTRSRSNSA